MRLSPNTLVLGEFALAPPRRILESLPALDVPEAALALQRHGWGGYALLRRDGASGRLSIYRDPGGDLDAFAWSVGAVSICASEAPSWLDPCLPSDLALDWERIGAFVINPTLQTAGSALRGVHAMSPGELWVDGQSRQLWRPADALHRRPTARRTSPADLAEVVRDAVARSAAGPVLLEVSGGLDSAIVAGCLPRLAVALNYFVRDAQGDERTFAREVAARVGVSLTEVEKPELALDFARLAAASGDFRPALNAFDHAHDHDVASRCRMLGIETLMTGQGGDDVFFQTPTPLIVADGLRHGLSIAELSSLARWQGRSVYGLLRDGLRAVLRGAEARPRRPPHVTDRAWAAYMAAAPHPWMSGLEGAPPAKAMQVAGLANALIVKGGSERGRSARIRHPLLAQPVVEYALGLTAPDLTRGRDRGLARLAFADVVPDAIARRPTKGRMSAHYGRVLANALGELRPLLLDGRLVARGLVCSDVLDGMLSIESLIWRAGYGAIINLIMVELWVRAWEARLAANA